MLLTITFWNRSYTYDLNQARAVLWIPNVYSRQARRMMLSIVSKAEERFRSVRNETFPESEARSESFKCEGGRSRCYGWSGRQTGKDEGGCYLTAGC